VYFLGIDGGGTKTDFLLIDAAGREVRQKRIGTISYKHIGMDSTVRLLRENIEEILDGIQEKTYICLAFPNWGESVRNDILFSRRLSEISVHPVKVVNDSAAGWAGSLGLQAGINLVAGTGSIAYGRNQNGEEARAGGWCEMFSDEGSCYWLGMKALELFSKESDGRAVPGKLLEIFRMHFRLKDDFDIIDIFEKEYKNDRTKIAGLQEYLYKAAISGDVEAEKLYVYAAEELAAIIKAVYQRLKFRGEAAVSYSGGLFHAKELILTPLRQRLTVSGLHLCRPKYSPVQGAALLAAWEYKKEIVFIERILKGLEE
jgi:N-acetylglucosamine kinase-like BadF-type ATPase